MFHFTRFAGNADEQFLVFLFKFNSFFYGIDAKTSPLATCRSSTLSLPVISPPNRRYSHSNSVSGAAKFMTNVTISSKSPKCARSRSQCTFCNIQLREGSVVS